MRLPCHLSLMNFQGGCRVGKFIGQRKRRRRFSTICFQTCRIGSKKARQLSDGNCRRHDAGVCVGCDWHTAKKYITEHPTVQQAYQNETERVGDLALTVIIDALKEKDVPTAKWYLTKKRKEEFGETIKQDIDINGEVNLTADEWRKQRQERIEKANDIMDQQGT